MNGARTANVMGRKAWIPGVDGATEGLVYGACIDARYHLQIKNKPKIFSE